MALEIERIGNDRCSIQAGWLAERSALPPDDDQYLVLDPSFQRGAVWTLAQKRAWIESILADLPLPAIFINRFGTVGGGHEKYGFKDIVIDGQQRIRALVAFMAGEFKVHGEKFTDQDEVFRRRFRMTVVTPVIYTTFDNEVDCAKLYLTLLTAGTAHTEAELDKARAFIKENEEKSKTKRRR